MNFFNFVQLNRRFYVLFSHFTNCKHYNRWKNFIEMEKMKKKMSDALQFIHWNRRKRRFFLFFLEKLILQFQFELNWKQNFSIRSKMRLNHLLSCLYVPGGKKNTQTHTHTEWTKHLLEFTSLIIQIVPIRNEKFLCLVYSLIGFCFFINRMRAIG